MVIFREVQYMRRVRWVMLLVLGIAAMMWWGFFQQMVLGQPWGSNPGPDWMIGLFWLIFGIGFPLAFYKMRLIVEVGPEDVAINYVPLKKIRIDLSNIDTLEARSYKPLLEYGGWGIRGGANRRVYNVSGSQGVELTSHDGRRIMIGSQKAQELALAIQSQLPI